MRNRWGCGVVAVACVAGCSRSNSASVQVEAGEDAAIAVPQGPATPRALLAAFAAESDCNGRGPFILNPDINLPLLLARAGGRNCAGAKDFVRIDDSECGEAFERHPMPASCSAYVIYVNPDERRLYTVTKTPLGIKVDWRSSVGYGPMSMAAYRAKQPTAPTPFRVKIKLADYFNHDFRGAKATHYSIHVAEDRGESISGYIAKTSPDAEKLFHVVEDGREHYVVLEMQYPPGAKSDNALITRFFHEYWYEGPDGF